jgi:hypothetical protein
MYRPSTPSERHRYGVPHRLTGSRWYQSSNTACVYPSTMVTTNWRQESLNRKAAHLRSFGAPQCFPLTGDGEHVRKAYDAPTGRHLLNLKSDALGGALAEARYRDWLDERNERRTTMARQRRDNAKKNAGKTLSEILIREGFAHNEYLLDTNQTLQVPDDDFGYPWNLPSRLMKFPLEVRKNDDDGLYRVGLMHPLMIDHPWVQRVAVAIAPYEISPDGAPTAFGYSMAPAIWWHAVDLIRTHWRQLLDTRRFTTDEALMAAVVYGLDYRRHSSFGPTEARAILAEVGPSEEAVIAERQWPDKIQSLTLLSRLSPVRPDGAKTARSTRWPINQNFRAREDKLGLAWGRVWGIEAGWFTYERSGHLQWSPQSVKLSAAA